jgi:hypothetical protein
MFLSVLVHPRNPMEPQWMLQTLYESSTYIWIMNVEPLAINWGEHRQMKRAQILSLILTAILLIATVSLLVSSQPEQPKDQVYVGVAFGGTTVDQAKLLIDRVKSYTNLFVLASGLNQISGNRTAVEEICDYATNSGLNIIVNLGTRTSSDWSWKLDFYKTAADRYGDKYLGAYYDDEPGGIPLDWDWEDYFTRNSTLFSGEANPLDLTVVHYLLQLSGITGVKPENYSIEAEWFHKLLTSNRGHNNLKQNNLTTFTSDYVLYWFDYLGGFDTLFAQLGHNSSNLQVEYLNELTSLALLRGAATMQNKDWGAIVTWKYNRPPYLDDAQNVYDQMKTAYNAGAKYIMVFDYPYNVTTPDGTLNPYGVLTEKHFQALRVFWNNVLDKQPSNAHAEAALVLPKDYGWGLRNPNDRIWGFWGPDDKSPLIWNNTQTLLSQYGLRIDIIYDDPAFPIQGNYSKVYYWNQTIT